ncbi:TIGR02679 family protein [Phytomonospora sp. NPDC050363]|uniref:TIGR02679 family protein n=1 Tax=Phytomonospora sp. NPDC050363 TaxID=3155642 RepID=UPI00340B056B
MSSGQKVTSVRLTGLTEVERHAISDLLGKSMLVPGEFTVRLAAIEAVTRAEVADIVTELVGPLRDEAAERARRRLERDALWEWLTDHPQIVGQPALRTWAEAIRAGGVLGSMAETRTVLKQVLAVLSALPSDGVPLPLFAETVLGDTHALDNGRVQALALRAVAALTSSPEPVDAETRRAAWASVGVDCDELSTTVLSFGLPLEGQCPLVRAMAEWSSAGHASVLTLAQLRVTDRLRLREGAVVHVVENPSLMSLATRRFGPACPPLVCTAGWPNGAGIRLLRMLADAGALLRYHGDFDPAGLRITAYVMAKTGAQPWRMSADDYRAAAGAARGSFTAVEVPGTPWDPELAQAMRETRRTVSEERVADVLLNELAAFTLRPSPRTGFADDVSSSKT